jgi:hypothetical protein
MKKTAKTEMNLQESFDYLVNKIAQQGVQCLDEDEDCVYGNDRGQHCGIGWLLDSENKTLMEHCGTVTNMIENYPDLVPETLKNNATCFNMIQTFHDFRGDLQRRSIANAIHKIFDIDISNPNVEKWIKMK